MLSAERWFRVIWFFVPGSSSASEPLAAEIEVTMRSSECQLGASWHNPGHEPDDKRLCTETGPHYIGTPDQRAQSTNICKYDSMLDQGRLETASE